LTVIMGPKAKVATIPAQVPPGGGGGDGDDGDGKVAQGDGPPPSGGGLKGPPKPKPPTEYQAPLVDIPCVYLNDRGSWADFKKALNECGLIWNLPDWMTTIVYRGTEWDQIGTKGTNLADYFPAIEKTGAGDGNESKTSALGAKLVGLLGLPKNIGDYIRPNVQFCCLNTVEFEADRKLPARQKLWSWLIRSLRGNKATPGPYHYLVDEVQMYDISLLFKRLVDVLEQITICSLDDELECVIKMDYKPQSQNIFSYLGDLRKAIKRLHDLNERLPEGGGIVLPDSYVRSRLIRAARQVPVYKPVLDALLIQPIETWSKITSDELYHRLEAVCANDRAVSNPTVYTSSPASDSLSVNFVQKKQKEKPSKEKKPGVCHNFQRGNPCTRTPCPYQHVAQSEQKSVQKSASPPPSAPHPQKQCHRCGSVDHTAKECKFNGACGWCGRNGHMDAVCGAKKSGRPKALLADGVQIRSNVVIVSDELNMALTTISSEPPPPLGTVCERFYADTGANRSIHPNSRSASVFSRVSLDISTASTGSSMKSEGVGQMKLYTSEGIPFPGFDKVVFSKQSAEKLASVGDLCDAGMVCVFDKHGLTTYKEEQVEIKGEMFTQDQRCKRTHLYPLTLYRKAGEKSYANITISFADSEEEKKEQKSKTEKCELVLLPSHIFGSESLPSSLLAQTYIKDGLSDIDRYHAKCGDIGIKYLKRAFPLLKIPKQYRCEYCIEGKIHKFGHGPCKPGERTEYPPGVCIHSDHSGPYARSVGGARYSQIFMDRGSGFIWGFRMAKKTGHYAVAPLVFVDSQALTGRPVQIFHTDGDGVFSSHETQELLQKEKIRHEYSAPYDSNTNPFIERARRTIFEGVCTALLRAGAPASFWGEAEAHKIFSLNVMPTVPDKEKPGNFISRKNLLEGNTRPFNLERLMAFGTATTCYVPIERRRGGKEPAQRRSFKGALLGYVENMPAYRIWDLENKSIRSVSFNFTICHEGYYPFRDRTTWPPEWNSDPSSFSPIIDGVLSTFEWRKFDFDAEETGEIFSVAPGLVVDRPVREIPPLPPSPR
jgi:transposase InsO family protein